VDVASCDEYAEKTFIETNEDISWNSWSRL